MPPQHLTAVPSHKTVTIFEVTKRITLVNFCLFLTLLGVALIRKNPRLGWLCTAVFGTMLVMSVVELCQLPRILKNRTSDDREAWRVKPEDFKRAYIGLGTLSVAILLGLVGEVITISLEGFWPNFAIWLAGFVATAAFFPFREKKKEIATFAVWAMYAVLCGFGSLAIAHLKNGIERGA